VGQAPEVHNWNIVAPAGELHVVKNHFQLDVR